MKYLFKTYQIDYELTDSKHKKCFLLLHGWGADKNAFANVEPLLTHNGRVLKMTLPTTNTKGVIALTLNDYHEIVMEILRLHDIKKVIVICHSFGLRVALELLQANIVSNIFITGGAGQKRKFCFFKKLSNDNKKLILKFAKNNTQTLFEKFASSDYRSLNMIERKTFKNIVNYDQTQKLKELNNCKNIYLFWGKFDKETPFYFAKKIKKICRFSKLFVVKSNHFAYLNKATLFKHTLNQFLCEVNND